METEILFEYNENFCIYEDTEEYAEEKIKHVSDILLKEELLLLKQSDCSNSFNPTIISERLYLLSLTFFDIEILKNLIGELKILSEERYMLAQPEEVKKKQRDQIIYLEEKTNDLNKSINLCCLLLENYKEKNLQMPVKTEVTSIRNDKFSNEISEPEYFESVTIIEDEAPESNIIEDITQPKWSSISLNHTANTIIETVVPEYTENEDTHTDKIISNIEISNTPLITKEMYTRNVFAKDQHKCTFTPKKCFWKQVLKFAREKCVFLKRYTHNTVKVFVSKESFFEDAVSGNAKKSDKSSDESREEELYKMFTETSTHVKAPSRNNSYNEESTKTTVSYREEENNYRWAIGVSTSDSFFI